MFLTFPESFKLKIDITLHLKGKIEFARFFLGSLSYSEINEMNENFDPFHYRTTICSRRAHKLVDTHVMCDVRIGRQAALPTVICQFTFFNLVCKKRQKSAKRVSSRFSVTLILHNKSYNINKILAELKIHMYELKRVENGLMLLVFEKKKLSLCLVGTSFCIGIK